MCIQTDKLVQAVKNGELKLWKVIRQDNHIGIWGETQRSSEHLSFQLGLNFAANYKYPHFYLFAEGQFHCFFTRDDARNYRKEHQGRARTWKRPEDQKLTKTKIIQVFARSTDVVAVGRDKESHIRCLSVSKMEIKSLKHQR